jgi:uncharacterized phage infection (PIP) family protein YhgE
MRQQLEQQLQTLTQLREEEKKEAERRVSALARQLHQSREEKQSVAQRLEEMRQKQATATQQAEELQQSRQELLEQRRTAEQRLQEEKQRVAELQVNTRQLEQQQAESERLIALLQKEKEEAIARTERLQGEAEQKQERLIQVKKEKFDTEVDCFAVTQQKRKADEQLQEEAKRHRSTLTWAEQLEQEKQRLEAEKARLEEEKEQLRLECVSCLDAVPNVVYLPCGHLCCCSDCDRQLPDRLCPKCRQTIQQHHRVFLGQQG